MLRQIHPLCAPHIPGIGLLKQVPADRTEPSFPFVVSNATRCVFTQASPARTTASPGRPIALGSRSRSSCVRWSVLSRGLQKLLRSLQRDSDRHYGRSSRKRTVIATSPTPQRCRSEAWDEPGWHSRPVDSRPSHRPSWDKESLENRTRPGCMRASAARIALRATPVQQDYKRNEADANHWPICCLLSRLSVRDGLPKTSARARTRQGCGSGPRPARTTTLIQRPGGRSGTRRRERTTDQWLGRVSPL